MPGGGYEARAGQQETEETRKREDAGNQESLKNQANYSGWWRI